ncbi:hypothetical protein [Microlunatus ginsengisoli]|uniref:Right handed beta helix region n=1 Tax=Microlunatus ginsengisoli TaxID=363863 RepID=A0ABP6ZLY1_9ACTN
MPPNPPAALPFATFRGAAALRALRTILVALVALATAVVLVAPADAATRRLTARDGHTSTRAIGTIGNGTARAAFVVPGKRASTVTLGLELRRKGDGDRYRVRATVARSGAVRVAVIRYRGSTPTVLSQRKLGLKVKAGQTVWVEGAVSGSKPVTVRVRAWRSGQHTPGWQRAVRDSSAHRVTGSGRVRVVVRLSAAPGAKKVTVRYRDARISPAKKPAKKPATQKGPKPSASTTGVPRGTKLKVHNGNIVVTRAGTRLDRLDIRGFVVVKAPNVTISRSIVRGGSGAKTAQGLVTSYGPKNLLITDTELRPAHPSVYVDGIKGWNFTARRVHVTGNVDSVKIQGDNVTVADSLLENTTWYAHDPYQGGGPTHNDNIQILKGKNLTITANTIRGAQNFAVLGAANQGNVPNLVVNRNWLDGGHCTVKLQFHGSYKIKATVTDNKFGPHRAVAHCPIQALPGVTLIARNNVSEQTGRPVQIWRKP